MKKVSAQVYDILETRSLVVQVGDLEVMNDDPSRADVLYLKGTRQVTRVSSNTHPLQSRTRTPPTD